MLALTFLVFLGILEAGLFLIGPALQNAFGPNIGNVFYVVLRVVSIVLFSYLCVRVYRRSIYGALSTAGFLVFLDQAVFKSLWIWIQFRTHPEAWQGIDLKGALYGTAFSYIVFLPLILALSFVGAIIAYRFPGKRPAASKP
jgi:hypothetical protein